MLPASMALIREAFPDPRRRAHALGIWAVGGAVAGAVGPLLGGLLTTVDWRLVFAINLPVCVGMLILLRWVAPSPDRPSPFDWAGQVLGDRRADGVDVRAHHRRLLGFGSLTVIVTLVVAAVGIVVFLVVEARGRHPMMPLEMFRPAGMRIALMVGFAFMAGWFGTVFFASLFLQQHLGLTPLQAGLAFLPAAIFAWRATCSAVPSRTGSAPRMPVVAGLLSMVVGSVA